MAERSLTNVERLEKVAQALKNGPRFTHCRNCYYSIPVYVTYPGVKFPLKCDECGLRTVYPDDEAAA